MELAESMERISKEIQGLRDDLADAMADLRTERRWRKAAAVLFVCGFIVTLGFVSHTRQADCDRTNHSRIQIRQAINLGFGSAWDELTASDPEGRAKLLDEIDRDVAAQLPLRDCRWPV